MTSTSESVVVGVEHLPIGRVLEKLTSVREVGPFALLVVLSVVFNFAGPAFLSTMNISNMLSYVPELGIMALGMTLLMTAGEIDLSVGAVFGFCPVLMFLLYQHTMPFEPAFALSMVAALLIGLANGLIVTKVRASSLITTIGMMLIVRGGALYITNGFPQSTWQTESWIKEVVVGTVAKAGDFTLLASLFWFIGLAVILHFVLNNVRFGNWILATGGNVKAAQARGVNTDRVKIILFVLCALLSGFAGVMDTLRISAAYPIAGTGYELEIIAMVVIGGTLLYGGKGTILGTVIGVLLLRTIRNGIVVVGVPGLAYNIFVGLIIVVMMSAHALIERAQIGES
jgi:simple sugar transport system permease protein